MYIELLLFIYLKSLIYVFFFLYDIQNVFQLFYMKDWR